jgi:glycosyltransferase involved in cell wall biosynthesis
MNRTDFIIASKSLPTSCLPAIFGKIFGAKIILDMDDLEYSYWKETRFERVLKLFDKNFPKFFNRVTTHTNGLINYVNKELKIPKKRIIFLPQGIVYEMFQNVKSNLKKQLGLKDYKIIVYTAHLGVAAKSNVIFKVIKNITKKKNNIKLIVVGGGRYLNYYKKLAKTMHIENNVIFTGYVDHKKISEYLSIADVAINYLEKNLANKYRSSIKVREYIASGVPVVCNIVSDDIEQLSRFLYYFDTGNLKEFEKQIFSALKGSNKKRISEGKNFVKNWDWKLIVKNFENELLKIK